MELNQLTIKEARKKLDKGEISSFDLTKACLDRIKKIDSKVKACITVCEKEALEEAKKADERIKKGEKGDLLGIPYIAKDNILTKGIKTTAASKFLENYIAPYDATIIKKLKKEGAVLLAKSNLDEFAHGASTENSCYGPTSNPWDLERVPGGSSGGSAAAVAADMCVFALGTDTGGSIRCPAGFCGVVGLKPSYGFASRFGLISMTSSTDVPGPITKSVEDAELVMNIIKGRDENDATTLESRNKKTLKKDIKNLKIGIPKEYFDEKVDKEVASLVKEAINKLKEKGAEVLEISLPHTKYTVPTYYIITPSEISSNLARFDGIRYGVRQGEEGDLENVYLASRGRGFGAEVKRRIMLGTYTLSAGYRDAYYLQAQKVRTKIKEELDFELEKVDCLITPTSPHTAFKIGEQVDDPVLMYLEDILVSGPSLAGLPAISIPCGEIKGLPVGMQIIGKRLDEKTLFDIGKIFQDIADWHKHKPNI